MFSSHLSLSVIAFIICSLKTHNLLELELFSHILLYNFFHFDFLIMCVTGMITLVMGNRQGRLDTVRYFG